MQRTNSTQLAPVWSTGAAKYDYRRERPRDLSCHQSDGDVSVTALKLHSNAELSDASPRYFQDWHRSSQLLSCCMQPSIALAEDVLFTLNGQPRCLNAQQSFV
jgi:hypothetical protein